MVKGEIITKTISNRVNRSLRGGYFVIGPVLFPAVSLRWLSITKMYSGILPIWSNGCVGEDKDIYIYPITVATVGGKISYQLRAQSF